jgi:hypothetical protein
MVLKFEKSIKKFMKKTLLSFAAFALTLITAFADEGMWIPMLLKQLNEPQMKKLGMRISAEDIYSINNGSLKDAIIQFGGGCTGEIVSANGLILTNHHCGYGQIQSHSKVGQNYLDDGFWAKSFGEELPNPGLTALFIVRIEDVTAKVLNGVNAGLSEQEREKKIAENSKSIEAEAIKGTKYEAKIRSFFYGGEYYMFVTETFKDVRLVGTPPQSIGKFGGDTDNWMWPRHTGDFSMFRIYADENNQPAEYSPNNKPYKPKRYMNLSLKPLKEGDFTLTYGFPGRTFEYLTSYGIEQVVKVSNPIKIKLRETRLNLWLGDMKADEATRIKYSSKYAQIANYYKKFQGENRGIRLFNGIERKQQEEKEFQSWASGQSEYANLLNDFKAVYDKVNPYQFVSDITMEGFFAVEAIRYAWGYNTLLNLAKEAEKTGDQEKFNKELERLKLGLNRFFKDYNAPTDRKIFPALIKIYNDNLESKFASNFMLDFRTKMNSDYTKLTEKYFDKTFFTDKAKVEAFLNGLTPKKALKIEKDPLFNMASQVLNHYNISLVPEYTALNDRINLLERTYIQGQRKQKPEKPFWPDANSTLRVAYGSIQGFKPYDGAKYDYFTTLDGIIEKMDSTNYEFTVPKRLVELYNKKDFGQYAVNGTVPVAFCATNHTTGGNSGSPLIDADGNLIGLNFDTNWEGTMSNYIFNPGTVRNICVDMHYVLFIIDKYAGATNIINELKIVN